MVYTGECEKNDQILSCVRVPDRITEVQKLLALLMLGMRFETKEGYCGVINELGRDCTIRRNTPLLSRVHIEHMIPNAIAELRREAAFETNVISEHAIPVDSLRRVFLVQPLALQHALNIP